MEVFPVDLAQQQSADRVAKAGTHALAVLDPFAGPKPATRTDYLLDAA